MDQRRHCLRFVRWAPRRSMRPNYPVRDELVSGYVESRVSAELMLELKKYRRSPTEFFDVESNLDGYNWRYGPGHVQNRPAFSRAVERVRADLEGLRGLKGYSFREGGTPTPKCKLPQETSPGATLRSEGYRSKGEAYDRAVEMTTQLVTRLTKEDVPSSDLPFCDMAGRPAVCGFWERKSRLIWVYPMEVILMEGMFASPFIESAVSKKVPLFGWWANKFHHGYQRLRDAAFHAKSCVSLDYSKFDQRLPPWLIYRAFSLLEECFDPEFMDEHRDEWEFVQRYFIHTPIRTVTGSQGQFSPVYLKRGGVPSGSWFTQTIDTICNALMMYCYFEDRNLRVSMMTCVGDDNYSISQDYVDPKDIEVFMQQWFNTIVSGEKSCVVYDTWEDSHFLGSYLSGNGTPVRPRHEVLINLMNPERTPDNVDPVDLTAERIVSYAYETGGTDDKVYYMLQGIWNHVVRLHPRLEEEPPPWSEISRRYWRDFIRAPPPGQVRFPCKDDLYRVI